MSGSDHSIPLILNYDWRKPIGRIRIGQRDHLSFELNHDADVLLATELMNGNLQEMSLFTGSKRRIPDGLMIEHARKELELLGEDSVTIEWFLDVIRAWNQFGHSGGSAAACLPVLVRLIEQKNLTLLTDDPVEWIEHNADVWPPGGIWQNKRNSEAFSSDAGKTYYFVSDEKSPKTIHTSEHKGD